jgi:hypothetical protein
MKRFWALVLVTCAALALAALTPAAASAAEQPGTAAAAAVVPAAAAASPTGHGCVSPSASWGKIVYQPCYRFNCDATTCLVKGYFGLINRATGPRTVTWEFNRYEAGRMILDSNGSVVLKAGEQRTIEAPTRRIPCYRADRRELRVTYDSSGWSPRSIIDFAPTCG